VRGKALRERAIACLTEVRIPDPERRHSAYPFELSGGMCQRVMIAIALACRPRLLIADEPTTGLDVTTQAAIMRLIRDLGREKGMATLLITRDLGLAREFCDRIAVMHASHLVETAPTEQLFRAPAHPYTAQLIEPPGEKITDGKKLAMVEEAFHQALVKATGNDEMARIHYEITEKIRVIRQLDFTQEMRIAATYDEHAQILRMLIQRKEVQAGILLKSHIEASKAEVRKITIHMLHTARQQVAQRT
jgi:ABC-type dipeptide/oligopeptide/nickel transport system ATPase component